VIPGPAIPEPAIPGAWRTEVLREGIAGWAAARPAGERSVVVLDVARPTLVLGSSQADGTVDRERAARRGVDIVRRRSGGAAVLVEPGAAVWIDVTIPAGDPLWDDDVGRAFHWLGAAWAEVLAAGGLPARMHDGPLRSTPWSGRVCFAGLGSGEVTVDGRKVVGLSQRRTREAARFQCCALLRWEPERTLDLLALDDAARRAGAAELRVVAAGVGAVPDLAASLVAAVTAR
jgi:lipoate---protein ligase